MKPWLAILIGLFFAQAHAACLTSERLTGVNLAGAEFNGSKLPGRMNFDFVYPSTGTLDYFAGKGVNMIRLPITWERLQPQKFAPLDSNHGAQLLALAKYAKAHDICLLIDLHNFGKFQGRPLSEYADATALMTDFWLKMAELLAAYKGHVALGLMNEPAAITRSLWADITQSVVSQLRAKEVPNLIIVAGGTWSGAHSWFSGSLDDPSNADLFSNFTDPANHTVIELHQYADSDYSGTKTDCISSDKMQQILRKVSDWGSKNNQRLFLGEFGVPAETSCLNVLQLMMNEMQSAPWVGWSYWAAGAWWGDYPFSIQPKSSSEDKPQMLILAPYLSQ